MEGRQTEKKAETNALSPIPLNERMGWKSLAIIQAGICVCVPAFLLGALLAKSMPVWQAFWSGTLGYVIVVVVMSIIGMTGRDLGVPTCICCQSAMGVKGARYIVSAIFAINFMGWFGIQNGVCGAAFSNYLAHAFSISLPVWVSSVLWGCVMLATAVFGLRAMERLDKIAIPLLMVIMALGTYLAIAKFGWAGMDNAVPQTMSFWSGVGLSFNFYAIGAVSPADYARFQQTRKNVWKSTLWGVLPMGAITLLMGIVMSKIADNYDISMVLIAVGIPTVGIMALILSTWPCNASNAYSAALNLVMACNLPDNRRREVTALAGIIGTILGAVGILDHVEGALSLLAFIACPVGGVMIADYWLVGKGKPGNWKPVKDFNVAGVISWVAGGVSAYLLEIEYMGIIAGMAAYVVLIRLFPVSGKQQEVPEGLVVISEKNI